MSRDSDELELRSRSSALREGGGGASLDDIGRHDVRGGVRASQWRPEALRRAKWSWSRLWQRWTRALRDALAAEEEYGHLFLFYPVFMIAGASWYFSLPGEISVVRVAVWAALMGAVTWSTRHAAPLIRYPVRYVLFFLLGVICAIAQVQRTATVIVDSPVTTTVTARVSEAEAMGGSQWRYRVEILKTRDPALKRPPTAALLTVRGRHQAFNPGEVIEGRGRLQPPAGPALPGLNDFAISSYFRGIGAIGFFFGAPSAVETTVAGADGPLDKASSFVARLRAAIASRVLDVLQGDTGAFATAIITNDRRAFSDEGLEALRNSGLAHVIAISGLHMALASGIFFVGLRAAFALFPAFVQKRPAKKLAAAGAIAAASAYFVISGGPVSAQRAFIMLCIMLGAVFLDRPVFSLRSVAIAAFLVIVISPSSVVGPSFQMSFAAAAALISGYSLWRLRPPQAERLAGFPFYPYVSPALRFAGGILLTSTIGGVSTALFAAAHFQRLALYGLAANLLAMPVVSFVVMPAALLSMLLMPFGLDELPLRVMGVGLDFTLGVAHTVSAWGGNLATGQFAEWVLPLASAAFVLTILPRTRLRYIGAAAFAAIMVAAGLFGKLASPALIISEDGMLAAFVNGSTLAPNRARPPSFIFDQWERARSVSRILKPVALKSENNPRPYGEPLTDREVRSTEDAMEAVVNDLEPGRFACAGTAWCIGRLQNGMVVITYRDPAYQAPACRQADIAIAATRLKSPHCMPYEAMLVDQRTFRQRGALSITLAQPGVLLPDEAAISATDSTPNGTRRAIVIRGALDGYDRPWNRHRYYDWRTGKYTLPYSAGQ